MLFRVSALTLIASISGANLYSQDILTQTSDTSYAIHQEIVRAVRQTAGVILKTSEDKPEKSEAVISPDTVMMAPVIVSGEKDPDLFIRRENPVQKFFRTGTFVENVGKHVTTKLWARGDSGIMLTFSW